MQVKELMQPVVKNWLQPELTLHEAVCAIRKAQREGVFSNGMVVLEDGVKLVGIVSIKDIIRTVIPSYMENNLRELTWDGMLEEHVQKAREVKVSDIMSKNVLTISPNASLMRCADLMIDHYLQQLPVVDDSGRVLGIIHIHDLYIRIADLMCADEE